MSDLPEFDGPVEVDLNRIVVCHGLDVAVVVIPDDARAVCPTFPAAACGPGLMLTPEARGLAPVHYLIRRPADDDGRRWLEATFTRALEELYNDENLARRYGQAHAANAAAGRIPGEPGPTCVGCGRRIFGQVAARGACYECFPHLPADDAARLEVDQ